MRKLLNSGIAVFLALAVVACGDSGTDKAMAPPPSASEDAAADKKQKTQRAKRDAEQASRAEKVEARRKVEEEARVAAEDVAAADRDESTSGASAPEAEVAAVPEPPAAPAASPPAAANGKPAASDKRSAPEAAKKGGSTIKRRHYKRDYRAAKPKKNGSTDFGLAPGPGVGGGGGAGVGGGFGVGGKTSSRGSGGGRSRGLAPAAPSLERLESLPVQPPVAAAPRPPVAAAPPPAGAPSANLESLSVEPPVGAAPLPKAATPAPAAPSAPDSSVALESLPPATSAPTAPAAPKKKEEELDWSVVPVFFGTDRQSTNTTTRVLYDWKRGRRLELGRALVTIPKKHEVPMVERPWALKIPYLDITLYEEAENPKEHFTLKEIKALTKAEFLDLVRKKLAASTRFKDHALIFVHGYKTKFDNAIFRTAQIAYDLKFDGATFLYSWPSGGTLQGYTYDRESAAQAEPYLRKFLKLVSDETGAKKLSVIAHSMGNQPLLRVLQDLKRSLPEGVLISQLILAAPDVDRDSFENIVTSIKGIAEGITLYAAANDTALQVSRQVNGGVPRAGDVPEGGPIVIDGIDTIDATATSMDSVGINHSGYAENNALLQDIGKLIGEGVRPPEVRLPTLERVETAKGAYWRYPTAGAQ
jgi:esterase/lipase superfamily enzyme